MRKWVSAMLAAGLLAGATSARAQDETAQAAQDSAATGAERNATYITAEQIAKVSEAEPIGDRTLKVIDLGYENFAVGIVDRGRTANGRAEQMAQGLELPPPTPCGEQMDDMPEGGHAGGITHSAQTEGYYIISGGGTLFTDGYIVNGQEYDLAELNGPTCLGTAHDVTVKTVKVGDVVVVPAGVVHGWIDVPDHVRYISFRPSPGILEAGWTHPAMQD